MKAKKMARSYEQKADPDRITPVEYSGPQEAFDHFNLELFDGSLPDVFITYQRKAHSHGYFSADRFSGRSGEAHHHELALNPDAFIGQTDKQILQTLVHEQHHVWQHAVGKPAPRGYHNKEWAAKMKSNGLQPSSTGMVGGKETGQHMLDYVIPGGRFEQSYERLADTGWKLNLESAHRPGPKGLFLPLRNSDCPDSIGLIFSLAANLQFGDRFVISLGHIRASRVKSASGWLSETASEFDPVQAGREPSHSQGWADCGQARRIDRRIFP